MNLELPCGRWYGLVCRLSQVKICLERLWCGSWEVGFLTWFLCCRWAGSLWGVGGNPPPWGAPGCGCLALWPWDTAWAGSSAVPALALGSCRDFFVTWEVKAAGLKPGVVAAFLCTPALACPCLPGQVAGLSMDPRGSDLPCSLPAACMYILQTRYCSLCFSSIYCWRVKGLLLCLACLLEGNSVDTCMLKLVMADPHHVI